MSESTNAPMPTLESQKKIVDAYLAAFKKTRLVMPIGGGAMLKHAIESGAGWRPTAWATWAVFPKPGATCAWPTRKCCPQPTPWTPGSQHPSPGKPVGTCGNGSRKAGRFVSSSTTHWPCTARSSTTSRHRCRRARTCGPRWSGSCGGWVTDWCSRSSLIPRRSNPARSSTSE